MKVTSQPDWARSQLSTSDCSHLEVSVGRDYVQAGAKGNQGLGDSREGLGDRREGLGTAKKRLGDNKESPGDSREGLSIAGRT